MPRNDVADWSLLHVVKDGDETWQLVEDRLSLHRNTVLGFVIGIPFRCSFQKCGIRWGLFEKVVSLFFW